MTDIRLRRSLAMQRWLAQREIDAAAAEARGRALTAGMDVVYMAKLQQAEEYLDARRLNPAAAVPPYVAADMAVDGTTPAVAAAAIVAAAKSFHEGAGPAIERARREAKKAVQAATDEAAVSEAVQDALNALRQI